MRISKNRLLFILLFGCLSLANANQLLDCVGSLVSLSGNSLYVRPGLPAKPAGDPKRQWTRVAPTPACQSLQLTDVVFRLQDGRVDGMQMQFAQGDEKVLFLLDPYVQMAVSAQLVKNPETSAMHPISIFRGDRSGFNYSVRYQKGIYTEILIWGTAVWGAQDER